MAHYYPVIAPAGQSVAGASLGFHAYSMRVDNCTNQWYFEESTVAYIPPYSLGMCLRLYGTSVAILLAQAPVGQPQLAPIVGEQVVGVYSDQLRTEVAASPIRQFTFVQAVSDLTEGPQPAFPPVGVDRLYADTAGNIHHLHSNGTDLTLYDASNIGGAALGGDLTGTINSAVVRVRNTSQIFWIDGGGTTRSFLTLDASNHMIEYSPGNGPFWWANQAGTLVMTLDMSSVMTLPGPSAQITMLDATIERWNANQIRFPSSGGLMIAGPVAIEADQTLTFLVNGYGWKGISGFPVVYTSGSVGAGGGSVYLDSSISTSRIWWDGSYIAVQGGNGIRATGHVYSNGGSVFMGGSNQSYIQMWNPGEVRLSSSPGNFYAVGLVQASGGPCYGNGAYVNTASSERLKHAIAELDAAACLGQVRELRPVSFLYNDPPPFGRVKSDELGAPFPEWTPERLGFIAEEVSRVVPQAVGMLEGIGEGLSVEQLVPVLWGALRDVDARLARLEATA